eukprot:GHVL01026171.1.p1 GENE.GHVL01026171.1~~GHVL01026171.1.p1  ORF type:complete len:176 (+),score=5.25 GHVL01026171.1:52-579(+)
MKYSLIFVLCLIYADASCTENDDKLLTTDWYPSFYSCFGDKNCIINTGLSEGCTDCWIGAVTCGAANCIAHCVGSNVSYCTKDCINCSKNNCDAQLKACTGLIKLPEPPTCLVDTSTTYCGLSECPRFCTETSSQAVCAAEINDEPATGQSTPRHIDIIAVAIVAILLFIRPSHL